MLLLYHIEQGNKGPFSYKFTSVKKYSLKVVTYGLKLRELSIWVIASCCFFCPGFLSINQGSLVGLAAWMQGRMRRPVVTWPPIGGVIEMLSRYPTGYPWWRSELKEVLREDRPLASAKWINSSPVPAIKIHFPNVEPWPWRRNSSDRETVPLKIKENLLQIKNNPFHHSHWIFDLLEH